MSSLQRLIAEHPLSEKTPYNAIKFVGFHANGTPLYTVAKEKKRIGARAALKLAMEKFGGHCFHCDEWMPPQRLSYNCTRDHVVAKSKGGGHFLHNLVFACGECNRGKASLEIVEFRPESGIKYLNALSAHLARCLEQLAKQ